MPVRLLTQSRLKWPDSSEVLSAVGQWAQAQAQRQAGLLRVGVFGSYGRGDAGVGSDLDLILIDAHATGSPSQRFGQWPLEQLPLSCDVLVLTPGEWQELLACPAADAGKHAMASALRQDCRWLWTRRDES
jgi:hypothetical protein